MEHIAISVCVLALWAIWVEIFDNSETVDIRFINNSKFVFILFLVQVIRVRSANFAPGDWNAVSDSSYYLSTNPELVADLEANPNNYDGVIREAYRRCAAAAGLVVIQQPGKAAPWGIVTVFAERAHFLAVSLAECFKSIKDATAQFVADKITADCNKLMSDAGNSNKVSTKSTLQKCMDVDAMIISSCPQNALSNPDFMHK